MVMLQGGGSIVPPLHVSDVGIYTYSSLLRPGWKVHGFMALLSAECRGEGDRLPPPVSEGIAKGQPGVAKDQGKIWGMDHSKLLFLGVPE